VGEVSPCLQPLRVFRHPLCGETPQRPDNLGFCYRSVGRFATSLPRGLDYTTIITHYTTIIRSANGCVA